MTYLSPVVFRFRFLAPPTASSMVYNIMFAFLLLRLGENDNPDPNSSGRAERVTALQKVIRFSWWIRLSTSYGRRRYRCPITHSHQLERAPKIAAQLGKKKRISFFDGEQLNM